MWYIAPRDLGADPERKRNMFVFCMALSHKEHQEKPVSGKDCPDALSVRSYKAKQRGNTIS
jgi:hypothetical protein